MKLNVKAFACAFGLLWGFGLFGLTWWIIAFEGVTREKTIFSSLYRGYDVSPLGSLIGLIWALLDGFFGGLIFAWLYNLLTDKFQKVTVEGSSSHGTAN